MNLLHRQQLITSLLLTGDVTNLPSNRSRGRISRVKQLRTGNPADGVADPPFHPDLAHNSEIDGAVVSLCLGNEIVWFLINSEFFMAHHSTSTSMHVNPVAQSYKQQVEGEDKRLIERGELKRCRPSTLIDV